MKVAVHLCLKLKMKNKKADIANFLGKKVVNKEITFPRKVKSKSECLLFKNKRADIAITILVIGVIVLCATALFSFYAVDKGRRVNGKVNSVFYLQAVYNLAESANYSSDNFGKETLDLYGVEEKGGKLIIKRSYAPKGIWVWSKEGEKLIEITYNFAP